jgi:glycogen synthase
MVKVFVALEVPMVSGPKLTMPPASATVCPSFGEGFGFSGVEAMRCGGVVAASDLPVHREVYGDAAEYFNPYSARDLAQALGRLLGAESQPRRAHLMALGANIGARYLPDQTLARWHTFFSSMSGSSTMNADMESK